MRFHVFIAVLLSIIAPLTRANHLFVREANTSLQLPQNPQAAVFSYNLTDALPGLTFDKPVGFAIAPGQTNRLYVVERIGRIIVITNLANPTRTLYLDLTAKVFSDYETAFVEGLSSLAFHPGYASNGFFYVTYTMRTNVGGVWQNHNRLARFSRSATNPDLGASKTELPLITQYDEGDGHNMNDLKFGPDNYLYCASGDEGDAGTGDDFNNAQRIDKDFFSAILRIDVDKKPGNPAPNPHPSATTNYAIPADNPFVGATSFNGFPVNPSNVRTEFYAVGFRNCWRISFDSATGQLYEGDVGQHAREEVNVVVKGGNYGWAFREGTVPGPKGSPPPGAILRNPILEYGTGFGTNQGYSVIGGVVYRGQRLPDLFGAYIFADYVSGNIWMTRHNGTNATPFTRITGKTGIAGFGHDPRNGDVLLADVTAGRIWKLDASTPSSGNIPLTLADTGAFSNLTTLGVQEGIIPYDVNVPFWSDNAKKRRWFSLPNLNLQVGFNPTGNWTLPATAVWIKHFDLEMTNGVPQSARRIETRFLVRNANGVYGLTYRWGGSTTNAVLMPDGGGDENFVINDGGTIRTQSWHYPSRTECTVCHTPAAGFALSFNTPQLNRDFNYGIVTNQIFAMNDAGYFSSNVSNYHTLAALAHATNSSVSREFRVRSYLTANCVQCHQPGAAAQSYWDARISTPISQANIINGPLFNNMGNTNNAVIRPGSLSQSMLLTRISNLGPGHMPPLATSLLDTQAINLVRAWITNDLAGYQTFAQWQLLYFGSTNPPGAQPQADPDGDRASNYLEYLMGRNPTNGNDGWKVAGRLNGSAMELSFFQKANRGFEVQTATNLNAPVSWQPLESQANKPFFSSIDRTNILQDPLTNASRKFYRVRVFEP